ncbi:MAG TPA: ATP-binding protein, partial [Polyangiaceae bacterium]|nr:ATP-binding protein [Polyangiaceae bacterium]
AQVTERAIPAGDSDPSLWRSGAQRVFRVTTAPIRGPDKRIHKIAELAQDISKDKIAQEKMVRAGRLAAVGELAGQIAHEVNNPIAIISAKARLLLSIHREQLSSKTIAELEKIVHQSDRVAGIAQGLLSYCRPSAGARAPVDVRAPLRSALSLVEQRARGLKVSLKDSLESTSVSVVANAGELEQVFLNLLLNAIDAMPDGGELSTTLTAAKDEDGAPWLQIDIADTGHGIDPDALEHIWDPFFTTKPAGRGTGLGLSICAGLIRSHNGHIDVRENSPVGTIMTVHLPVSELTANA